MRFLPLFRSLLAVMLGVFSAGAACAQDTGPAFTGELPKLAAAPKPLLPAPAGMLLDQAGVFQPEAAGRLAARLQEARAQQVWVYVLTVPTLGVLPSRQREELETLAKRYLEAWLPKEVGAMILFDDEGGLMTIETSREATRRFSEIVLQIELVEPVGRAQMEGLARDKLEKSASIVVDVLTRLQGKYQQEVRRQRIANGIMAVLALAGVALLVRSATGEEKKAGPEAGEPAADAVDRSPPVV